MMINKSFYFLFEAHSFSACANWLFFNRLTNNPSNHIQKIFAITIRRLKPLREPSETYNTQESRCCLQSAMCHLLGLIFLQKRLRWGEPMKQFNVYIACLKLALAAHRIVRAAYFDAIGFIPHYVNKSFLSIFVAR